MLEPSLGVETALTDHIANPETIAAEAVRAAESAPAPMAEPDNAIELVSVAADAPVVESVSTPVPVPVSVQETAPQPVPIPEAAPQQEPEKEPAVEAVTIAEPTPATEPAPVAEPVPAAEPVTEPIDLIDPIPEQRAEQATVAEPATEPVPAAEPATVAEPAPATEPVVVSPAAPSAEQAARQPAAPGQEPAAPGQEAAALAVLISQPAAEQMPDEKAAAKLAARQKMRDEASELSPFSVSVGQVYDGPLDLLLTLIRSQDIDIYDIPIAKITAQFLAYVNQLKASDVDVAGEFIYTASLLIHIKSKMLLPRAPAGPGEAPEDPRRELVERLLEHERFKNAAQMLQQKQMLEAATWSNPGSREFADDDVAESEIAPEIAADTLDLVRIFRDILERARKRPIIDVSEDSVTVGQMIQFLARRLTLEDKPVALRRLLSHTRSERALVAMFLALLELVRLQAILLRQDRAFSEIFIKKHTGFDAVISGGLMNVRDDWK
ncbi:MAG: segregation/condensation protein A [Terracidiphilus sp.]